ncbi:BLUF domain-containing protein [Roseibium aggregatum]|uniref:BLUF domain-containing protein n=1 Tax=Roseibium aggregatum TaxID=187304 RepID=A0A926P3E2_9HYPH|nr:BLUF domain-containing protein [Roseibium aggregatum]MBD1548443.1 BLUF domain-containing protein [Roseibium aggregatum]
MTVHHLVYVSQAAPGMSDATIAEIVEASRAYNAAHGITGVLLFVPGRDGHVGSFMQLLEGESGEVKSLTEMILADPRHHTKVVLTQGQRERRCFPDWSMALKTAAPEEIADHPILANLANKEFMDKVACGPEANTVLPLLMDFWDAEPLD